MFRSFFLTLILAVSVNGQVPIGATKQEVIDKLGWPKSTSGSADREILSYSEFSVFLTNGHVVKLQFKAKDGKRPNTYTPPPSKVAPVPAMQPRSPVTQDSIPMNPGGRSGIQPAPAQNASVEVAPHTPVFAQAPAPSATHRPTGSPVAAPTMNPFAPVKKMAFWMIVCFIVLAGLKVWARSTRRSKREEERFFPTAKKTGTPLPPLQVARRNEPAKADPPPVNWSLALLKEIEWHRFEHVVAAYERELGNDAELTDFGPDGGIDVQVFEKNSRTPKRVIQCKAFDNQKVGVELVRAFFGAMTLQKVQQGAFYTTSGFTPDAIAVAQAESCLDLVDGPTFLNRIERLNPAAQARLLEVATEGDYATPTCPSCGVKMFRRTSGKGAKAGTEFWGCRNFPRCKQTFKITHLT